MKPLVSVVMPAFNAAAFIERTIATVQSQTLKEWELIIVDDASTDDTLDVLAKVASEESRIRIIALETNSGAAVARNKAIEAASGRYIAFLDCDDLWYPEKLEKQLALMNQQNASFCYGAFDRHTPEGVFLGVTRVPKSLNYRQLLKNTTIGCLTAIYDTKSLGKVYMPLIRKRQDYALWLRLLKKTDKAVGILDSLGSYTVREGSISSNKLSAAKFTWKVFYELEALPLWQAIYYFAFYAKRGIGIVIRSKIKAIKS